MTPPNEPAAAPRAIKTHVSIGPPALRVALQGPSRGLPVVLSHALGLSLWMWEALATELATDHPVLCYDHRGHGGSAVPADPYTIDELVADAARVIREWGRGPVVFVGLSMGGMVGQGLGILRPDLLRGLVLANTTSQVPESARPLWDQRIQTLQEQGMAGLVDGIVERWFTPASRRGRPALVRSVREQLLRCDPQGYIGCCHAIAALDWHERLAQVRCPTLVLAGEQDPGTTAEIARSIAEAIPAAQLEVLPQASHMSVLEQPRLFADAVKRFLGSLNG